MGLERYIKVKKHEFIKSENEYIHDDLLIISQFRYVMFSIFEELSDNDSIHQKFVVKVLFINF